MVTLCSVFIFNIHPKVRNILFLFPLIWWWLWAIGVAAWRTNVVQPRASVRARVCPRVSLLQVFVACGGTTSSYGFAHLINNESQHNDTFFQCITREMGSKLPWSPSCLHPWHRRPSPQPRHRLPKTNCVTHMSPFCTNKNKIVTDLEVCLINLKRCWGQKDNIVSIC